MTLLQPLPRDSHSASLYRDALLSRPPEFFTHVFGGCAPSLPEKLGWIEERVQHMNGLPSFANDVYVVVVERHDVFYRLSIQRHDRQPCREWKHLQQMKNQLFGASHEAVELYPSEERLIDTNNEYHLWVHADPSFRFPLGFQAARCVTPAPVEAPRPIVFVTAATGTDHVAVV